MSDAVKISLTMTWQQIIKSAMCIFVCKKINFHENPHKRPHMDFYGMFYQGQSSLMSLSCKNRHKRYIKGDIFFYGQTQVDTLVSTWRNYSIYHIVIYCEGRSWYHTKLQLSVISQTLWHKSTNDHLF